MKKMLICALLVSVIASASLATALPSGKSKWGIAAVGAALSNYANVSDFGLSMVGLAVSYGVTDRFDVSLTCAPFSPTGGGSMGGVTGGGTSWAARLQYNWINEFTDGRPFSLANYIDVSQLAGMASFTTLGMSTGAIATGYSLGIKVSKLIYIVMPYLGISYTTASTSIDNAALAAAFPPNQTSYDLSLGLLIPFSMRSGLVLEYLASNVSDSAGNNYMSPTVSAAFGYNLNPDPDVGLH
ncbi:MAG: hypothetical protein KKH83_04040 [Candidatus Margulisbacteria bacterium]|nr:hypothetical protein [Candidatus Margulisiibacteriota bacterium]